MRFLIGTTDAGDAGIRIVEPSTPSTGRWVTFTHGPWVEPERYTTWLLNALIAIELLVMWLILKKTTDLFAARQTRLENLANFESQIVVTSTVNGTQTGDLLFGAPEVVLVETDGASGHSKHR